MAEPLKLWRPSARNLVVSPTVLASCPCRGTHTMQLSEQLVLGLHATLTHL
jgi:hypothetical protein